MTLRANNLRELQEDLQQALVEDGAPLPSAQTTNEDAAPEDAKLVALGFARDDIAAWRQWMKGGPAPTTPGGLELLAISLDLSARV